MAKQLCGWSNDGTSEFASAAAPEVVSALTRINAVLQCPLIIAPTPKDFFGNPGMRREQEETRPNHAASIMGMAQYMFTTGIPQGVTRRRGRLARIPWTKEELKAHLKCRRRQDEINLIKTLEREG